MASIALLAAWWTSVSAGSASAQAGTAPPSQAVELYERARDAFAAGEYREAAVLLERAYVVAPDPVLLHNRARALERTGDVCEAAIVYRRFLREAPSSPHREAAGARLAELDATCATQRRPEPAVPAPDRPQVSTAPPPVRGPDLTPSIVTLGIGAAGLVLATVSAGVALERRGFAEDPSTAMRPARDAAVLADDLALVANVAWAIAGSVALAGLLWLLVEVVGGSSDPSRVETAAVRF